MLSIFGLLACSIALIDGIALLFGLSLTGVFWSPFVFLLLGLVLCILEAPREDRSAS